MITYFKNQLDLSKALVDIIDDYWNLKISESDFIKYVRQVSENNKELIFKDGDYTPALKQRLGIKRINLLNKILKNK